MATVEQVARAALSNIIVQGSEAPLEADEYQDFIFAMNNFMLDLDANGVKLGYTEVSDLSDEITIPSGALRGLIFNMGIEVASEYGGFVSVELVKLAERSMNTMRKLGQSIKATRLPSTLPVGSGNEGQYVGLSSHFYSQTEAQILAETTGVISLEANTNAAI